jgi:hypothetical protein
VAEFVESDREIASSLMDFYLSSASHRMNEIMRTLTIIATIFIPARVRGRDLWYEFRLFDFEMEHAGNPLEKGLSGALLLMAAISAGCFFTSGAKAWIGNRNTIPPPPEEEPFAGPGGQELMPSGKSSRRARAAPLRPYAAATFPRNARGARTLADSRNQPPAR